MNFDFNFNTLVKFLTTKAKEMAEGFLTNIHGQATGFISLFKALGFSGPDVDALAAVPSTALASAQSTLSAAEKAALELAAKSAANQNTPGKAVITGGETANNPAPPAVPRKPDAHGVG